LGDFDGLSGSCAWVRDDDTLVIRPLDGKSGVLDSWDMRPPWHAAALDAQRLVVEPGVAARTCSLMCSGMTHLFDVDVSGLDTSAVHDMSGMFNRCESLVKVDLSALDGNEVVDASRMFSGCASLADLTLPRRMKPEVLRGMFDTCLSLACVSHVRGLDLSCARDVANLFSCSGVVVADLSGQCLDNVGCARNAFAGCEGLSAVSLPAIPFAYDVARDLLPGSLFSDSQSWLGRVKALVRGEPFVMEPSASRVCRQAPHVMHEVDVADGVDFSL
jgi:hypothetical protein